MEKPILKISAFPTPRGLEERVVSDLRNREILKEKKRSTIFASVAFASLLGIVAAIGEIISTATQSGFARYVSLVFSDWSSVTLIWKTFALSIVETAPIFGLAICSVAILAFLWSGAEALRYAKAAKLSFN